MGSAFLHWSETERPRAEGDNAINKQQVVQNERDEGGISVDRGVFNVDVIIPASLLQSEDMDSFDEKTFADENGYSKAKLNEDGSITVTMSKSKYDEVMKKMAEQYDQNFSDLVEAEDTPYIKSITRSKNFDEIMIEVDRDAYENSIDLTPFVVGLLGMMYQTFNGDNLHVEVIVKDVDTGDLINSITYPDALESSGEDNPKDESGSSEGADTSSLDDAQHKVENIPQEYKNALKKAENYSDMMHMSKQAIYDQLTSEYGEKFPEDAAQYAIDNLDADYKENALKKARTYYEEMNMSKEAVRDQLISDYGEKFTEEEADYAIENLD